MRISLIYMCIAPLYAQFGVEPPSFGCHALANGQLRALHGLRSNLVATAMVPEGVKAGICAAGLALYQTAAEVTLSDGKIPHTLPASSLALIALERELAVVYDAGNAEIHYWKDGQWRLSPATAVTDAVSIRLTQGKLAVLARDALYTIDIVSGGVESYSPVRTILNLGALTSDRFIITIVDDRWILCRADDCTELAPAPQGVRSLIPLSEEWFAATTDSGPDYAFRVRDGVLESFILPGGSAQ